MDELIGTFIRAHFSDELVEEIYVSFGLFGLFNHGEGFESFDAILSTESTSDGSALADAFIAQLHKELDYLLEHHTLTLEDAATLEQKNTIIQGLYMLQYLEDYSPVIRILESSENDDAKIVQILAHVTSMDEVLMYSLVEGFRPMFLHALKEYTYDQEPSQEAQNTMFNIRKGLMLYKEIFGHSEFTQTLLEAGLQPGEPFMVYVGILRNDIMGSTDPKETALRIYWTLLFSCDGALNPLVVYREHSEDLLEKVEQISEIERLILSYIGRVEELRKVS